MCKDQSRGYGLISSTAAQRTSSCSCSKGLCTCEAVVGGKSSKLCGRLCSGRCWPCAAA